MIHKFILLPKIVTYTDKCISTKKLNCTLITELLSTSDAQVDVKVSMKKKKN